MDILSTKLKRYPVIKILLTQTLTVGVLIAIGITAWQLNQRYNLHGALLSQSFLFGSVLATVYRVINPIGWSLILRGMGHSVSTIHASKIWLMSESRRWLPGGVWGYASRAIASTELGITKTNASASMAIELLVTIAAAIIVSLAGVAWHYSKLSSAFLSLLQTYQIETAHIAAVIGLTLLTLTVLVAARRKIMGKFQNAIQRFSALRGVELNGRILGHSLLYMILMAALNGAVNSALLPAIDPSQVPIAAMIAATAAAWTIGFLAIFSPGGILVREAALATILLPWLPWESGFALAILSRFAQLLAEVVGMLLVMGLELWRSKTKVESISKAT